MGIGAFGIGPASKFATELQTRVKSRAPARPLFRFSGGRAALGLESGILSGADELIDWGGNRCVYELRTHRSLNKDAPNGCSRKKRSISLAASGPCGSV